MRFLGNSFERDLLFKIIPSSLIIILVVITTTWAIGEKYHKNCLGISEVDKEIDIAVLNKKLHSNWISLTNHGEMTKHDLNILYIGLIVPEFLVVGGVETWIWTFMKVLPKWARVYAIQVSDSWSVEVPLLFEQLNILFNPGTLRMQIECDLIISTGIKPLMRLNPDEVQLLVIHGGGNCEWTKHYSKYHLNYNHIIGVSNSSSQLIQDEHKNKWTFIPTPVFRYDGSCDIKAPCEKPLLWLGRISFDKRPELFCKLVDVMSDEFCGWMIGPYYDSKFTFTCSNRTIIQPYISNPQCAIRVSHSVINTSPEEGGPIIALESWLHNKPFYMFDVGLMNQFGHHEYKFLDDDPRVMMEVIMRTKTGDYHMDELINKQFSPSMVRSKWEAILQKYGHPPVIITYFQGGHVFNSGRSLLLRCYNYCIYGGNYSATGSITFYYTVESHADKSSIKFDLMFSNHTITRYVSIDQKMMMTKLTFDGELTSWRLTMSETSVILYFLKSG